MTPEPATRPRAANRYIELGRVTAILAMQGMRKPPDAPSWNLERPPAVVLLRAPTCVSMFMISQAPSLT